MKNNRVDRNFWREKRVFITGNTGFKGSWLSLWLHSLGADVKGYSLEPNSDPAMFSLCKVQDLFATEFDDIRNFVNLNNQIKNFKPHVVVHMAAQSLVRKSYSEPLETFSINVVGTANVFEACRNCDTVRVILNVTSDKCYENNEWLWGYRENERLGGSDPYSSSKACAELVANSFRTSYFQDCSSAALVSVRAGNVIGGGDWSTDRLIPDALRAVENSSTFTLRNPEAVRPWQHVIELLSGYLQLMECAFREKTDFEGAWNFGPSDENVASVAEIITLLSENLADKFNSITLERSALHEAQILKLDSSKARSKIGWSPVLSLDNTIKLIVDWHNAYLSGSDMAKLTLHQINSYSKMLSERI